MTTEVAPAQPAILYQRAIRKMLDAQAFVLGGNDLSFKLEASGYTDMLRVSLVGQWTTAATKSFTKAELPHGIVKKFLVGAGKRGDPINIGGRMLRIVNVTDNDFGTFPVAAVPPDGSGDDSNPTYAAQIDRFPVVAGAAEAPTVNQFRLNWVVPFHRSVVDHMGALPTGGMVETYLKVSPANGLGEFLAPVAGSALTDISAFSATMTVEQVYYTAPPADANVQPGTEGDGWMIKLDETDDAIERAGIPAKIAIDPTDTILAIYHSVSCGGKRDSSVIDRLYLQVGDSYFTDPAGIDGAQKTLDDASEHGRPMPDGVFVWDRDLPSTGMAGWIHTDGIRRIEVGITAITGTDVSAGTVKTATKRLVQLVAA